MKVAVCGGGSIALTAAAVMAARPSFEVTVLTRRPEDWSRALTVHFGDHLRLVGSIQATNDPARAIAGRDWVLLAVPAYARADILERIRPCLDARTWVGCIGSSVGFDWLVSRILGSGTRHFGLQRAPWIARTVTRGRLAHVTAVRASVNFAGHPRAALADLAPQFSDALGLACRPAPSFLAVTLGFDNATLHPPRLYTLFSPGRPVLPTERFYGAWDDAASDCLLALDDELSRIRRALRVADDVGARAHFGVDSAPALTARIRAMAALRHIAVPALASGAPELASRFFQEDFVHGLAVHGEIGRVAGIRTPTLDRMRRWAESLLRRPLGYDGSRIARHDDPPFPQAFGYTDAHALTSGAPEAPSPVRHVREAPGTPRETRRMPC
ncbi:NAD/NADP octopine/nopaline dehydrogenase family protein [Ralstonia solanacearum]|uniref:NAD/NADP octopine/nopaline dehydrogenase family protein n=1 Tax=Ralstonia solanacearum TaxID=305 RepID=UPI0005C691CF|nr:NAD/NADP octopine/nopaline dehydrogenase family protein [Ralstonia solanacearum]MBB6591907.1 NAD/NADP octopine/nopaline dehydrogenase family protein [Ralstonia solanacearum]MBB6596130.1 NAD/NADP octopine/nopaline dehydrogenase family protein [Ralstonia solanacearum]MDB0544020.1 NAD/NADP octopine/nopaline dehydrogenase family protein [Ralstonia solanacearum]MDB0552927.1 NAD/NADP octopine/nopaline dehydrogenase family protein [Ralstonia solanacearum]MDB0558975.1 NAD/NADP octopine/nopaline deh